MEYSTEINLHPMSLSRKTYILKGLKLFLSRREDFDFPELGVQGFSDGFEFFTTEQIKYYNSRDDTENSRNKSLQKDSPEGSGSKNR